MRIAGITIPDEKRLRYSLAKIYGVGYAKAGQIASQTNIDEMKKVGELTEEEATKIRSLVESQPIEGELRRQVNQNIKRLKDIQSYRGGRHSRNLPVRGQTTRVNSRTMRGNKRSTMGSGKTKVEKT